MMLMHIVQDATVWSSGLHHWIDTVQVFHWHLPTDLMALDKPIQQTDLWGDFQKAFNNFVKTGQAWAFVIGIVIGYMIKTFTSFG